MQKFIAVVTTAVLFTTAHAKEIALTFDDSPRSTGNLMTGMERARKLTDQFKKHGVQQVAFFCNSPTRAPDGPERLQHFANHGHVIANHSHSHPRLSDTRIKKYQRDIAKAHDELKHYPNFRKWFRYPFLNEGKTIQKRDAIRKYLAKIKYLNAYVTIDNQDYHMEDLLRQAVDAGRKYDEEKLCGIYRDILADDIRFYDDLSVQSLGRSVKHVLLLHETDINAICLGHVITWLRDNGWSIITADEAFTDPIAQREPDTLFLNQGRVAALAKEKGYSGPLSSKWNSLHAINEEFLRRKIFE